MVAGTPITNIVPLVYKRIKKIILVNNIKSIMHVMYSTNKSRVARLANKERPVAGIGPAIKCTLYNWYNTIMLSCRGLHVYDGTIWNDYVRIVVRRFRPQSSTMWRVLDAARADGPRPMSEQPRARDRCRARNDWCRDPPPPGGPAAGCGGGSPTMSHTLYNNMKLLSITVQQLWIYM